MIKNILLDLDGVIVNFVKGFCDWYGIDYNKAIDKWNVGDCEMTPKQFGLDIKTDTMWAGLTYDFWTNLEFEPWAHEILDLVKDYNVTILTSPTTNGAGGKQAWIRKNLPDYWQKRKYLIGPDKNACAHPKALLIDDRNQNIDSFREAGGHAIMFPRIWNKLHEVDNPIDYLEISLEIFRNIEKKKEEN